LTVLLDANVLIAILDTRHADHITAQNWFIRHRNDGWATCPLTENAVLRIMGRSNYPEGASSVALIERLLADLTSGPGHHFWPDDLSLLSSDVIIRPLMLSPKHLTDTYLLALAVTNEAKLVTLERNMQTQHVVGGTNALVSLATG